MRKGFGESWQIAFHISVALAGIYTVIWTAPKVFSGDWGAGIGYLFFAPIQVLLVSLLFLVPVWIACVVFMLGAGAVQAVANNSAARSFVGLPWVRWIAIIPGALTVTLVTEFPLHWLVLIVHAMGSVNSALSLSNVDVRDMERFGVAFLVPFVLVYASARIAPAYRAVVSVVATAVVFALVVGFYGYAAGARRLVDPFPLNAMPILLNVIGLTLGFLAVRRYLANEALRSEIEAMIAGQTDGGMEGFRRARDAAADRYHEARPGGNFDKWMLTRPLLGAGSSLRPCHNVDVAPPLAAIRNVCSTDRPARKVEAWSLRRTSAPHRSR